MTTFVPKTLVTVFGEFKGVVIQPGKPLPPDPENWVKVAYSDHLTQFVAWVPLSAVALRKAP